MYLAGGRNLNVYSWFYTGFLFRHFDQSVPYDAHLCDLVPALPLTFLPAWENNDQLREECILRCVGDYACDLQAISRRTGKGTLRAEDLTNWIMKYCRGGCTLSNDLETGVLHCDIGILKTCLVDRRVAGYNGLLDEHSLRLQMQGILQLELEYTKLKMYLRDQCFSPEHPSAGAGIPLDRLLICNLHCPMRTHEKILTLLMKNACHNRVPKKSMPILDAIAGIIRRIGNLGDEWTYKMDDKSGSVQKIKMHWDQSKYIFKTEHMADLKKIIRLAVAPKNQADWVWFIAQYIKCIDLMTG
jgi:hypothetical protein